MWPTHYGAGCSGWDSSGTSSRPQGSISCGMQKGTVHGDMEDRKIRERHTQALPGGKPPLGW